MVESHRDDVLLVLRQPVNHLAQVFHDLRIDEACLDVVLAAQVDVVEYVVPVTFAWSGVLVAFRAEVVEYKVVRDACQPAIEFVSSGVFAVFDCHNRLDESVLEYVLGYFLVFHQKVYVGKKALLVAFQHYVECLVVAINIKGDQCVVLHLLDICHYLIIVCYKSNAVSIGNPVLKFGCYCCSRCKLKA